MTEYTADFEMFWKGWPGRWRPEQDKVIKVGKYDTSLVWKKLSEQEKAAIMSILPKVKRAGTQYLPDAERWLKHKRWHDFL